jgi:hypothetical protein
MAAAAAVTVLALTVTFVRPGGMHLVGIQYDVFVNNAATVCPDQVISQNGRTIALADGRSFDIDLDPEWLAAELSRAEDRVFVDTVNGVLYGRYARSCCGFSRPQRSQLVTLPLIRKDLPSHGRTVIARISKP